MTELTATLGQAKAEPDTKLPDLQKAADELSRLSSQLDKAADELEALLIRIYGLESREASETEDVLVSAEPEGLLAILRERTDTLSHNISRIVSSVGALRSLA